MIVNIIDNRKRPYRFRRINAIVEAAWHDNSCKDADPVSRERDAGPDYEEREAITLTEALSWAMTFATAVTLYFYDDGCGITARKSA